MRCLGFIPMLLISPVLVQAQDAPLPVDAEVAPDPRLAQISAASADAVATLHQQVQAVALTEDLTLGALVQKTNTKALLVSTLEKARQIGGPRWLDAQTVQVRMEIGGETIVALVDTILREHGQAIPVTLEQVDPALKALATRQFTASGSSAAASVIEDVRPAAGDEVWSKAEPQARREAIAIARRQAAQQVIESARTVALPDGRTLGAIIDKPESTVRSDMEQYLLQRPVTAVRFREDKQVEVTISAPPAQTFETLRRSIEKAGDGGNLDESAWAEVQARFVRAVAPATGLGQLPQPLEIMPTLVSVKLPEQPPLWVREMIDAVGSAEGAPTRLKTRHAAEQEAMAKLRQQVLDLPLTPELKVGDAAQKDPEIAAAVDRALARARAYKSDYFPDGRVIVRSSLELRDVWDQLQER